MGVKHLWLELAEEGREFRGVVASDFVQPGAGDELVTQDFDGLTQRKHAQPDTSSSQFRQFAGDERLREFREDVDDVGNPARHHGAVPSLARFLLAATSERINSTARL